MTVAARQDKMQLLQLAIGPACHELRSPLAVVYGFARMLEDADPEDGRSLKYVPQIVRGAERLDSLLDDLSRLGRVAAGRSLPHLEQVKLAPLVADLAAIASNQGRLSVEAGPDVEVRVDPAWLSESLQAVIDGLCFEEGVDVRLSWRAEQHELHVQVVPNSGFPMIDVEPEKSGLGISLARMRVVAMGGTFEGTGDRVAITLPRGKHHDG